MSAPISCTASTVTAKLYYEMHRTIIQKSFFRTKNTIVALNGFVRHWTFEYYLSVRATQTLDTPQFSDDVWHLDTVENSIEIELRNYIG